MAYSICPMQKDGSLDITPRLVVGVLKQRLCKQEATSELDQANYKKHNRNRTTTSLSIDWLPAKAT